VIEPINKSIRYRLMDPKLVREQGCADALSVSVRTLRYCRRRKIIPFLKVGALVMYDLEDVLQALKTFKREVSPSGSANRAKKTALKTDQIKAEVATT
jgi:hypothetical protein